VTNSCLLLFCQWIIYVLLYCCILVLCRPADHLYFWRVSVHLLFCRKVYSVIYTSFKWQQVCCADIAPSGYLLSSEYWSVKLYLWFCLSGWWLSGLDTEESWTYSGANSGKNQWSCKCVNVRELCTSVVQRVTWSFVKSLVLNYSFCLNCSRNPDLIQRCWTAGDAGDAELQS